MEGAASMEELNQQLAEMEEQFDLLAAWTWIRYSYGNAYLRALKEEKPLSNEIAHKNERAAWAKLPI